MATKKPEIYRLTQQSNRLLLYQSKPLHNFVNIQHYFMVLCWQIVRAKKTQTKLILWAIISMQLKKIIIMIIIKHRNNCTNCIPLHLIELFFLESFFVL